MEDIVIIPMILIVLGMVLMLRAVYLHQRKSAKWQINERTSASGKYYIELTHMTNSPVIIAALDPVSDNFDWDLEEARSEAKVKAIAFNSRAKLR